MGSLSGHSLTVTQLSFSPDSSRLLVVSRDRTWSLHSLRPAPAMLASTDKKTSGHTRLIWTCTWTPDSKYFFTGSREGRVAAWAGEEGSPVTPALLLPASVTALAAAAGPDCYTVAAGLESGEVRVVTWRAGQGWGEAIHSWDQNCNGHHATVTRLAFQPNRPPGARLVLASCSADTSVRITSFTM